jgi:2-dehydro-3-deoxyglucarate aldolase
MTLKQKLRTRTKTIGSWLSLDSASTTEIMAKSGYEWLVIDREHTATTEEAMHRMIQVIDLAGCVPLVRVGANDPLLIKHAMDCGSHGVVVPMVSTVEEAKRAVSALYYPPVGTRGVGLFRAQNYGQSFEKYKEWAATESILIVQIEHWMGVDNLDAILSVEGVDGFIIGPYDLSGSLGDPGNFKNPKFIECLRKVESLAKSSGKSAGYHIVHPDHNGMIIQEKLEVGYNFIAHGVDMIYLSTRVASEVENLRKFKHL